MIPTLFEMRPPVEGLTVVGEATQDAPPDIAELSFDIHSVGLSAAIALQENAAKAKHIGQLLASLGDRQTELKAGGVEVLPILQLPNAPAMMMPNVPLLAAPFGPLGPNGAMAPLALEGPNLIGYRAVSSIKVAVRDVQCVGEVLDVVIRSGAIPNGTIRFRLKDEEAFQRTLFEEAVRGAREKATVLAAALGKTTGNPISIAEEFTAYQPQQFSGNGRQNPFVMAVSPGNNVRLPFIQGQLTFCAKVSVVYQLQ